MKIKYVIAIIALVSCTNFAQELLASLTWNTGIPVSKMNQYTSDVTYRGFTIAGRRFIDKENSVGFMSGWNIFAEKSYDPINIQQENGSGTISGRQVRSINSIPVLIGMQHFFGNKKDMRTFVGINTGVYYILQRLDMGVYRINNDNWHFGIAPEAGLIIPFDGDASLELGARYNYAFDSGTAFGGAENNFYSFWEINIGFAFSSRWF